MPSPKGPAIPEDTFNVTGHCCGVRFIGIADMEEGFPFQLTPEARRQLEAQGMSLPPATTDQAPSGEAFPAGGAVEDEISR
jgi:hypothetical protein